MWNNPEYAQKLVSERNVLVNALDDITALERQITDAYDMIELAEMENDADLMMEAEQAFTHGTKPTANGSSQQQSK